MSDATAIVEKLDVITTRLDDIQRELYQQRTVVDACVRRVERLENEIWGDGQTGLAVRVRALLWLASGIAGMLALIVAEIVAQWVS